MTDTALKAAFDRACSNGNIGEAEKVMKVMRSRGVTYSERDFRAAQEKDRARRKGGGPRHGRQ